MLNDTLFEYIQIRAVILLLHAIGPVCTAYAVTLLRRSVLHPQPTQLNALHIYCAAEAAFFLFFLWYRRTLQHEAIHPPLRSKEERKKLFDKMKSEIHDPEKFLGGWFLGAEIEDIGRDDLKDYLSWAFWEGRTTKGDEAELEEMTVKVEKMVRKEFKAGKGKAKSLRLTLDPIEMEWRSLLWYGIIMLVDTVSHLRLLWHGMKYHSTPSTSLWIFPPRPLAAVTASKESPANKLSYWVRPHTSKKRLPILWIHGIGVGMHPHIEFMHELDLALNSPQSKKDANDDGEVGILSLEIMQICSRLTHPILTRTEFLSQLTLILDEQGYSRFVLVSHSYGSVFSTYILTDEKLCSRVSATFLMDPVTILLHMPDVAFNFTVRKPKKANEWQLWYFASKDPGTAYTLGRHFFWSENILWRDHITSLTDRGMRITASLAERDLIVDAAAVGAYLMEYDVPDPVMVEGKRDGKHMELMSEAKQGGEDVKDGWKTRAWKGKGLEVMWWDDLDHAQVFDTPERRKKLVDVCVEYSRGK